MNEKAASMTRHFFVRRFVGMARAERRVRVALRRGRRAGLSLFRRSLLSWLDDCRIVTALRT
jgi:hypothetical protein